jgi:hypothetical protein
MCTKFKSCHFSITDIIDVDENVEVMLFCSFHDCLPEDTPADCDTNKYIAEYTDAMVDELHEYEPSISEYEDDVPF